MHTDHPLYPNYTFHIYNHAVGKCIGCTHQTWLEIKNDAFHTNKKLALS